MVSLTGATGGPLTFTLNGTAQSQFATVTQGADELGVLTIAIAANGTATWTFNPTPDSTGNPSFSFTATVTDADGDVDADTHTISITEGAPPTSSGTLALVVDEKDLADGTTAGGDAGGDPDTRTSSRADLCSRPARTRLRASSLTLRRASRRRGPGLTADHVVAERRRTDADGLDRRHGGDHAGSVGPADGGCGRHGIADGDGDAAVGVPAFELPATRTR